MPIPTLHLGIFYMPQICDMGLTALLPLRRKVCWGFFRPEKCWHLRLGLNPRTWVLKGSTLTLDHRSRFPVLLLSQFMWYGKCVPIHAMKACRGYRGIAPFVHDLGTRWKWVVNPIPWPLHSQGKSPWCPLNRRLCGPLYRSSLFWRTEKSLASARSESQMVQPLA